ncbi:MAG: DUF2235 domain-containing protein [Rhodothermales bacterium]|nr:DUF2235 domain-containing protein [Rhodothermales bacterium]
MAKNIALFLHGTPNKASTNTNVWRLHEALSDRRSDDVAQQKHCDEGVGTEWFHC